MTANTNIAININPVTNTVVKNKVGRPAVNVTIPSKGSFTIKDLQTVNPSVKPVTLRAHVIRSLKNGTLTKLVKTVKSGKKGKPAFKFMTTESLKQLKAMDVAKSAKTVKTLVTV